MLVVAVAEHVDASLHIVRGDVERDGAYAGLVVDGGLGQHGDEVALLDELEQYVDLVQLDFDLQGEEVWGDAVVEGVSGLQSAGW